MSKRSTTTSQPVDAAPALAPDPVPALVAEMVHAVGAAAAKAEPAVVTTSTPPDGAVQVTVTSTCPLAALPLGMRFACPWERGRLADGTQVYRCAACDETRKR